MRFPIYVVAEWLGNGPKTALAHYTQVTQEHYRLAVGGGAAQNPAQQAAALARGGTQARRMGSQQTDAPQDIAMSCGAVRELRMTPTGFEPVSRP
jgi:hypothetical protein